MTESETLFNGRWLTLKRRGRWEYVERANPAGAVIVIAVTDRDEVLFVEQYRVPIECKTIEMPAGLVGDIDAKESLLLAAERELLEETGWRAGKLEHLMTGPSSAGMSTERMAFVRASELERVHAGGGDDSEDILVHEIDIDQAPSWLAARMAEGYEIDAKVWAGLWFHTRNPDGSPAR